MQASILPLRLRTGLWLGLICAALAGCDRNGNLTRTPGKPIPANHLEAWVGVNDANLTIRLASNEPADLYRMNEPDCDIDAGELCAEMHKGGVRDGTTLSNDIHTTLTTDGFYAVRQGEQIAKAHLAANAFPARWNHQAVVFKKRLWVIGGDSDAGRLHDVWASSDGLSWQQQLGNTPRFSGRDGHQVVVFKNALWLIGGKDDDETLQNDLWTSDDGIKWEPVAPDGELFSPRDGHQAVVFDNALWVIGGNTDSGNANDIWRSTDGRTWQQQTPKGDLISAREDHQVVVFKNALWLVGGNGENDIWTSSDGVTWEDKTPENNALPIPFLGGYQVAVYNDGHGEQLWATSEGYGNAGVWSSSDGAVWTQKTPQAAFSSLFHHQMLVFDAGRGDELWLVGGGTTGELQDDYVWSSSNGIDWQHNTLKAGFSGRGGYQVVAYDDGQGEQLWVIGGYDGDRRNDVWSSSDGLNWTLKTVSADFSPRQNHQVVVFDDGSGDRLWVIGGHTSSDYANDVWSSRDGIDWQAHPQPAGEERFSARREHQVVVFDEAIWVIGGRDSNYQNDVWRSTDGTHWEEVSDAAEFSPRYEHQVVSFSDSEQPQLWLFGGYDGDRLNDIWLSTDGKTWQDVTPSDRFSANVNNRILVTQSDGQPTLWLVGGDESSEVWSSTNGKNWDRITEVASFNGIGSYELVSFTADEKEQLWLVGGYNFEDKKVVNEVWRSDDGTDWRLGLNAPLWFGPDE
ncbi:hypothetical protein BGP77_00255 [Saccharospirillum sp. MSK14-1]|uniref:kelch repeat-containing protein n=1 Tax=Saccharospirillum sp. MSK14-1 TaxID=1897632 RepID=UPI000D38D96A|nr:kelch repeat-containing protein [Saccharospirillum sp. MSK14-1]PTY35799.1 hypothetical protein BGP77_00255 [Saccharospirillum sp. MSK14-1]